VARLQVLGTAATVKVCGLDGYSTRAVLHQEAVSRAKEPAVVDDHLQRPSLAFTIYRGAFSSVQYQADACPAFGALIGEVTRSETPYRNHSMSPALGFAKLARFGP
jgi:hypothetical protein